MTTCRFRVSTGSAQEGSSGSNPRSVVLALNAPQIQTFLR
nr:MAG TPA: hypothetical protein [Caudoviricetes sp.]